MSIAEKIATITENEPRVYDSGVIRGAYEAGKLIAEEKPYINTSKITDFYCYFYYGHRLELLQYVDTSNGKNFASMFAQCSTLTEIPQIDISSGTNLASMFDGCLQLEEIPQIDTSNGKNFASMFSFCKELSTIESINVSNGTNLTNLFYSCDKLTEITFVGDIKQSLDMRYSSLLTHDSLMSIINALYDYSTDTSGTNYTLTIGNTNIQKLTQEELGKIESKGWSYQ